MFPIDEETMKRNLSNNLLQLRSQNNPHITQEMLACKIGVTQKTLSRYECGYLLPTVYTLASLANYYGYTMDELLSDRLPIRKGRDNRKNENITHHNQTNDTECQEQADR